MLNTIDPVGRERDDVYVDIDADVADPDADEGADPLTPAVGLVVGMGVSTLLWLILGGLVWLVRAV